jgi:hypothetical protein
MHASTFFSGDYCNAMQCRSDSLPLSHLLKVLAKENIFEVSRENSG